MEDTATQARLLGNGFIPDESFLQAREEYHEVCWQKLLQPVVKKWVQSSAAPRGFRSWQDDGGPGELWVRIKQQHTFLRVFYVYPRSDRRELSLRLACLGLLLVWSLSVAASLTDVMHNNSMCDNTVCGTRVLAISMCVALLDGLFELLMLASTTLLGGVYGGSAKDSSERKMGLALAGLGGVLSLMNLIFGLVAIGSFRWKRSF